MNFPPNSAAMMTGRQQNQQQHLPSSISPTTTSPQSSVGGPQGANLQKPPNSQVPNNPQTSITTSPPSNNMGQPKINDDINKNLAQTGSHQHMHQTPSQNNNNHGMSAGVNPQLINLQQQASGLNMNRNVNVSSHQQQVNKNPHNMPVQQQQVFQQQAHFASITQASGPKGAYSSFQQQLTSMQNVPYQQQAPFLPNQNMGMPNQSTLQKLQASVPPVMHQMKQPQQQQTHLKTGNSVGPALGGNQAQPLTAIQQMQYSPPKSQHQHHPQLKITTKLASPGSQLQKSPTTAVPPQTVPLSPSTSQNKNVPSTPTSSHVVTNQSAVAASSSALNVTSSPPVTATNSSPSKAPTAPLSVVKQSTIPVSTSPVAAVTSANISLTSVPSHTVTSASPSPLKTQANTSHDEGILTKAVEQPKETFQASLSQKSVPKPVEEKKLSPVTVTALSATETYNKMEKPTPEKANEKLIVTPSKPVVAQTSKLVAKSTMRLATVTPARQRKPPPTNNKKSQAVAVVNAVQTELPLKSPAKTISPPVKQPETPKSSNAKKHAPAAQVAEAPKSVPVSTTTAVSISSSSSSSENNTTPKTKRARTKVQPYQSPTPELALVTKLSTQIANSNGNKNGAEDKLTIFYKNEFLAVRNGEGGFYLCQTMHNIYKSTPKIRIRWLNEKEEGKLNDKGARTYNLDFYDATDFECVLTTVDLEKVDGKNYELPKEELTRIESILKKAIDVEKGIVPRPTVTEENPDGLDLSLYKDEAQLDVSSPRKRKRGGKSETGDDDDDDSDYVEGSPKKKNVKQIAKGRKSSSMKLATVDDESTESDEENLMEIKNKAKSQQQKAVTEKSTLPVVTEPAPSTSKAIFSGRQQTAAGRATKRRGAKTSESEVPVKVAKTETVVPVQKESHGAVKATPSPKQTIAKPKSPAKGKGKKAAAEKPVEIDEKVVEKRPTGKKTTPVPEKVLPASKDQPNTPSTAKSTPETTPTKKAVIKGKKAPATPVTPSPKQQQAATPSTSRSRTTRSKK